ncbi:MAG: hypothetical protein QF577_11195, partial [Phycisphaerae bacterium]|nr:hypothetical protein [Phycisphaerae bacterium]
GRDYRKNVSEIATLAQRRLLKSSTKGWAYFCPYECLFSDNFPNIWRNGLKLAMGNKAMQFFSGIAL